jgi:hypothetical protein
MMSTIRRIEGSMGATRCDSCRRTTEYNVVVERRVLAGPLAVGRRWLAQCSSCAKETELSRVAARMAVKTVSPCDLRPAIRAA